MLSLRQKTVLDTVVEQYIMSAVPISSQAVFELSDLDVSCPTIRNEMAELTNLGYLAQPHTSAGRVPTAYAYRVFVDQLIDEYAQGLKRTIHHAFQNYDQKNSEYIAKKVSGLVSDAVMFVDEDGQLKYLGLRKLFRNPEFQARETIIDLIEELERLEDALDNALLKIRAIDERLEIFIGSENPFFEREDYSVIISPMADGFISLLGPTRMNYRHNLKILEKFL